MPTKKEIHGFAEKWLTKFEDHSLDFTEYVDHYMSDDCRALGFEMDCGHSFGDIYGEAVHNSECLERVINEVTDIDLLGSAIYSNWRYFNHWAYDEAEILLPKNRKWFLIALSRLATLTE